MADGFRCRGCLAGLEHCHGTLINHPVARAECTEPDCVTAEGLHAFSIDCDAIGCLCLGTVSAHRVG